MHPALYIVPVAYLLTGLFFYSLVRVAARADQRDAALLANVGENPDRILLV